MPEHALQNSCLHRGGPVCNGPLANSVLTWPLRVYRVMIEGDVGRVE